MNQVPRRLALLLVICLPFLLLSFLNLYRLTDDSHGEEVAAGVLPIHRPLSGSAPINIRMPITQRTQRVERKMPILHARCPVPNYTGIDWEYYTSLPEHNSRFASRALELTADSTQKEPNNDGNIPHRLIFTHHINLLDCDIWKTASTNKLSPQMYNLAQNVHATISAYKSVWGDDLEVVFLSDDDCISAIKEVESSLVGWFNALEGMYKADICRAAYLYLHGGYYFDVDVLVVRPFIASQSANFITIKGDGWPDNGFFQAFVASTKSHPIMRKSIDVIVEMLWKNNRHYLGPMSLIDAWKNITAITGDDDIHLLAEVNMNQPKSIQKYTKLKETIDTSKAQLTQNVPTDYENKKCKFSSGACNVVVVDEADETLFFYSRLVGTTWCGKQMDCDGLKGESDVTAQGANPSVLRGTEKVPTAALYSSSPYPQSANELRTSDRDIPLRDYDPLDDALGGNKNAIQQLPAQAKWLISSAAQDHNKRIPKIINKIYFAKDGQYPAHVSEEIKQAHRTWSNLNPGYEIRYFNLITARQYLRRHFHPVFLRAFDCIQAFAGKSDLFRMALIFREGGFHTDWKTVCLQQNLLDRIANSTDFFAALDYGSGFVKKSRSCAANAFVGATPSHPIVASYLEFALKNVQSSLYGAYVLMSTGPCVFGRAIMTHEKAFGNDTVSWPIHLPGYIHWKGEGSQAIVATKCPGCGEGQDWEDGNNYMTLWKNKNYYCEDAASIFNEISNGTTKRGLENHHVGWQSNQSVPGESFSWRSCFKISSVEAKPSECRENNFDVAPAVEDDWIPDVGTIRAMLLNGKDRNGNRFPPLLNNELCEDINEQGGRENDTNKECFKEAMIEPTGMLNSTTVTIDPSNHFGATVKSESITLPSPRLMCLIYTMGSAHSSRIQAMRDTWAGGCDGFLAFSTESDPRLPAISLVHDGPEEYSNMWQKVRSIWRFVGEHYLDDYDWFFIGGDDLFVMPHNLKTYLASLSHKDKADPKTENYFVGRRFKIGRKSIYFNSGGAGYALSQATLRKFLTAIDDAEHCSANKHTAEEDVEIAICLKYLGINVTDTRDAKGRERFHPFSPAFHFKWSYGDPDYAWYQHYNKEWGLKSGKDCCAPDSVSFHYIKDASMVRHLHALLYSCDDTDVATDATKNVDLPSPNGSLVQCHCVDCDGDQVCGGIWLASRYPGMISDKEVLQKKIRVVISHCNKNLDWTSEYLKIFNVASVHVLSKCGVQVQGAPNEAVIGLLKNVGRNDHTFAYYITSILPSIASSKEDSVIVFLKDSVNEAVHQGGRFRQRSLSDLIRVASSENGFACGLKISTSRMSAYHDKATLSSFFMYRYTKGQRDYNVTDSAPFHSSFANLGAFYTALKAKPSFDEEPDAVPVCYGGIFAAKMPAIHRQSMQVWRALEKALERGENIAEGHYAERSWARLMATPLEPFHVEALQKYADYIEKKDDSVLGPLMKD